MKRPDDKSATVAAAIAIVGVLRTNTLLMLVPSRMLEVWVAQAARIAPVDRVRRRTQRVRLIFIGVHLLNSEECKETSRGNPHN
jgi:hypothetical protein